MIYILNFNDRAIAEIAGATLITMSGDGTTAMMRCETLTGVTPISTHDDSERDTLMSQEFWRQPCVNC